MQLQGEEIEVQKVLPTSEGQRGYSCFGQKNPVHPLSSFNQPGDVLGGCKETETLEA
jgi:hypothetical protein